MWLRTKDSIVNMETIAKFDIYKYYEYDKDNDVHIDKWVILARHSIEYSTDIAYFDTEEKAIKFLEKLDIEIYKFYDVPMLDIRDMEDDL